MNKPYFYEVGYYSPEDSNYTTLTSLAHFTQDEFDKLILLCVPDAVKNYIEHEEEKHEEFGGWTYRKMKFYVLHKYIIDVLIKKYSFTPLKLDAEYSVDGWDELSIKDDRYSEDDRYSKLNDLVIETCEELGFYKEEKD